MLNCPECGHVWAEGADAAAEDSLVVKDANGNLLADGDSVTVIKDLKVKGSSTPLKIGTKVKSIRLVEGDHNIDCKIDGFGPMKLKSEFVKKTDRPQWATALLVYSHCSRLRCPGRLPRQLQLLVSHNMATCLRACGAQWTDSKTGG